MKKFSRLCALLLAAILVMPAVVPMAGAFEPTPVNASDSIEICLRTGSSETLLKEFSVDDMRALVSGYGDTNVYFSGIDAMPATVQTIVFEGVYLDEFLDYINENYVKNAYPGMDVWNCQYIRTTSTDKATGRYTVDDMINTTRYYYPDIHEAGGGMNEDGEIDCPPGTGTPVKTMLSIDANQQRLPDPGSGEGRNTSPETFTLVFGISEPEAAAAKSRVSEYKRGINKLIIDMGSSVTLPEISVTGISLDRASAGLAIGKSLQLTETITPADATNKSVIWKSGDESVATVSPTGVVTAVRAGTVTITVTSSDNAALSAACVITVSANDIAPSAIKLDKTSLNLSVGSEKKLSATVTPSGAVYGAIEWTSSDEEVATVDQNGGIKAVAEGTAVITAAVKDSALEAACTVTVTKDTVEATGLGLNRSELRLKKGEAYQLKTFVAPENATGYAILWSSNMPSIVSVDTNGLLTAKNDGDAVITAIIEDTKITARCAVSVSGEEISFSDIEGHWGEDSISEMVELGFIKGYEDGGFVPDGLITRAEFITILLRVLQDVNGMIFDDGNSFGDTQEHWARTNISTAVALGITSGYGNGEFGPDDPISREQVSVMLANAVGYDGSGLGLEFSDSDSISPWAADKVAYAAQCGWLKGYADGSFMPGNSATRAEVCAMMLRFYSQIIE